MHQLGDLVVVEGLPKLFGDSLEAVKVDHSVSFGVPQVEYFLESLPGFIITNLRADDLQELIELDGPVELSESVDHLEDDLAAAGQTQLLQHLFNLAGINGSSSVLIEQIEGFFQGVVIGLTNPIPV